MSKPLVSVVLPVKNCCPWLAAALQSIRLQTCRDWELVVVEDGSTDRSREVVEEACREDPRICLIEGPGQGPAQALNDGVERCQAHWIARMDGDDISLPGRLERQLEFASRNPGLGLFGAWAVVLFEQRETAHHLEMPSGAPTVRQELLQRSPMVSPTFFFRKKAWEQAGGFRPLLRYAEDYDFAARVAVNWEVDNLPQTLLKYRVHGSQATSTNLRLLAVSTLAVQKVAQELAAGRPDPLAPFQELSLDTLVALGLSPRTCLEQILRVIEYRVQFLLKVGAHEAGRQTLAAALQSLHPWELAAARPRLDWLDAQIQFHLAGPVAASKTLATHALAHPVLLKHLARWGISKAASALPSTALRGPSRRT